LNFFYISYKWKHNLFKNNKLNIFGSQSLTHNKTQSVKEIENEIQKLKVGYKNSVLIETYYKESEKYKHYKGTVAENKLLDEIDNTKKILNDMLSIFEEQKIVKKQSEITFEEFDIHKTKLTQKYDDIVDLDALYDEYLTYKNKYN